MRTCMQADAHLAHHMHPLSTPQRFPALKTGRLPTKHSTHRCRNGAEASRGAAQICAASKASSVSQRGNGSNCIGKSSCISGTDRCLWTRRHLRQSYGGSRGSERGSKCMAGTGSTAGTQSQAGASKVRSLIDRCTDSSP